MNQLILIGALSFALAPAHGAAPQAPPPPGFFAKQGIKVLSYQRGVGGLHVWTVERGATKTVLYTTPDNAVLLSAVAWDANSGINLSDAYITPDMRVAPADAPGLAQTAGNGVSNDFGPNKVSDAIKGVAALTGIKEGNAAVDKTLYIIFDPRCKYCHSVYLRTRQYVKSGGSIKWIPTTVLGDRANGARFVADLLQAKNPVAAMADVMLATHMASATPSAGTTRAITENEGYFFAAFDRNQGAGSAGVPVAFFETKAGAPQMVASIDDEALLARILTDIKK